MTSAWEYDAPQFFDFTRVGDAEEAFNDTTDYFTVAGLAQPDIVTCSITTQSTTSKNTDNPDLSAFSQLTVSNIGSNLDEKFKQPAYNSHGTILLVEQSEVQTAQTCKTGNQIESPSRQAGVCSLNELHFAGTVLPAEQDEESEAQTAQTCKAGNQNVSPSRQADIRGRVRCVTLITNEKKRLSMSVDRGRDKLSGMALALGHRDKNGSVDRLVAVPGTPSSSSDAVSKHRELRNWSEIKVNQEIIGKVEAEMDANHVVVKLTQADAEEIQNEKIAHPKVVPYVGIPLITTGGSHKRKTVIKPFSFEERIKKTLEIKAEKIRQAQEAEKKLRTFHAQPFPDIVYPSAASKNSKPPLMKSGVPRSRSTTMPKKEPVEPNHAVFKAKPATVVHKTPFKPLLSDKVSKPLTVPVRVELNTDRRAVQRTDWTKWREEKEKTDRQLREEREHRIQKEIEAETRKMRQMTVHKAQPVPRSVYSKSRKSSVDVTSQTNVNQ